MWHPDFLIKKQLKNKLDLVPTQVSDKLQQPLMITKEPEQLWSLMYIWLISIISYNPMEGVSCS